MKNNVRVDLGKMLPSYMLPSNIIFVEDFYYTGNGKIDMKKLQAIVLESGENVSKSEKIEDFTNEEATVWNSIIDCAKTIGIDSYICESNIDKKIVEIGLQSLDSIKFANQLTHITGVEVSYKTLVELAMLKDLVTYIINAKQSGNVIKHDSKKTEKMDVIPLNSMQLAYLFGKSKRFEASERSTSLFSVMETNADYEKFEKSLNILIQRHPALRSIITRKAKQQILEEAPYYNVKIHDLTNAENFEEEFFKLKEKLRMKEFSVGEWPCFAFEWVAYGKDNYLMSCIDPIFIDGQSITILLNDLESIYSGAIVDDISYDIVDYYVDSMAFRQTENYEKCKEYWEQKINDFPNEVVVLPKVREEESGRKYYKFSESNTQKIIDWTSKRGVSLTCLLVAAYKQSISSFYNSDSMVINMTTMNRRPFSRDVDKIAGEFTNIILCEFDTASIEFEREVLLTAERLTEYITNRDYDGIDVLRLMSSKQNNSKYIVPFVFTSFINSIHKQEDEEKSLFRYVDGMSRTSQVYLDCQGVLLKDNLEIIMDYNRGYLDDDIMDKTMNNMIELLRNIL